MKKELEKSLIDGEKHENVYLYEKSDEVEKCKDVAAVIREYEKII